MPIPLFVLMMMALGFYAAIMAAFFGGPDGKRNPLFGIAVLIAVFSIGFAGFYSLGWLGVLISYVAAIAVAGTLGVCGAYIYMFFGHQRLSRSLGRLAGLSDEQLVSLMVNPADAGFRLAAVELKKRGASARPAKERLFEMLVSGEMQERAWGLTLVHRYYPELQIAPESSSTDPPEVWRSRIQSIEGAA